MSVTRRPALLPPDEWYPAGDAQARSRFVSVSDGERVRVVEAGPPDGTPVLLVHGWGASAYGYRRLLPLLAAAGLHGMAVDLRGHGLSDKPRRAGAYTSQALVQYLSELLDALRWTRGVVAGQSMGGALTFDLVHRAPERFLGAVLVAPIGLVPIRRIDVARRIRARRWAPRRVPRWMVTLQLKRVYGERATWDERDVDQYWAPLRTPDCVSALAGLVEEFDWTCRSAAPVPVPIHVVLGERDRLISADRAAQRVRAFPDVRVRVISGAGHVLAEEVPNAVAHEILAVARRAGETAPGITPTGTGGG